MMPRDDTRSSAALILFVLCAVLSATLGTAARLDATTVLVQVQGTKVDAGNAPFAMATIRPYGVTGTCGSSLLDQHVGSCAPEITSYVAFSKFSPASGLFKIRTSGIPLDRDVIVSVCGNDGLYGCTRHPADSYCRPTQSTSSAMLRLYALLRTPAFVDIRWAYVPPSLAVTLPHCDPAGFPRRVPRLTSSPTGDISGDGFLTPTDGIRAGICALRRSTLASCLRADLDHNGVVGQRDAVNILRLANSQPQCSGNCDADGDALDDTWEVFGLDADSDGIVDVDIPAMGSHPFRKDVFVEVDYMVASDHTHLPSSDAMQDVVTAFAAGTVSNIDGSTGITLHIDTGQLGGGNELPHQDKINEAAVNAIRSTNFDPRRQDVFHYGVIGHDATDGSGGNSFDIPSDRFEVTQNLNTRRSAIGGTFMHELGHNLGLHHGGDEDRNFKPNYLSVMSYSFQNDGLIIFGAAGTLDYSRFTLAALDENNLNEFAGLDTTTGDDTPIVNYGTIYFGTTPTLPHILIPAFASANVDWDIDQTIEASVRVDIDMSRDITVLRPSQNDWEHLVFDGGAVGRGTGVPVVDSPPCLMPPGLTEEIDAALDSAGISHE
jgi:hypothetical protein